MISKSLSVIFHAHLFRVMNTTIYSLWNIYVHGDKKEDFSDNSLKRYTLCNHLSGLGLELKAHELISSPQQKAQVSFSNQNLSIVHCHCCCCHRHCHCKLSHSQVRFFLIACCLSSVYPSICPSVCPSFHIFNFFYQGTNFNQTCHKASLHKGDSSLFKWRTIQFS